MNIDDKGFFISKSPFTLPDEVFTCVSKTKLQSLVNLGLDIFTLVYEPVGFTSEEYVTILASDPVLLTLSDSDGNIIHIPEKSVSHLSLERIVPYTERAILINLGAHAEEKTFNGIEREIKEIIRRKEGLDVHISTEVTSRVDYIGVDDHNLLLATREDAKDDLANPIRILQERELLITKLNKRIADLTSFITIYMETCCGTDDLCGAMNSGVEVPPNPNDPDLVDVDKLTPTETYVYNRLTACRTNRHLKSPLTRILRR